MKRAAYWGGPALVCLLLHWRDFLAWFRADDFAWLSLTPSLHSLFAPMAQGTIRPLTDRLFFIAGFALFGLHPLPFRLVVFATEFANLALVAWIGTRLTGKRSAGFCAAVLWTASHTSVLPLGWASAYNQVLCGFFLLLAFSFLLRYVETGDSRYNLYQWIAFLAGFGAMEINVVYPLLAAVYTYLCAREYLRRVWPLFLPSVAYFAIHQAVAPAGHDPAYVLHFTGGMLRTLGKYWAWTVGPLDFWAPVALPHWLIPAAVVVISLGLLTFAASRGRTALFCLVWFAVLIAPVLPLRDHVTEYYPFLPAIGLCWLGGWALAETRIAMVFAAIYLAIMVPRTIASSNYNYRISLRVRDLVEGVERIHQEHPGQTIALDGVDTPLFYNAVLERPFRLIGVERVYLTPESARRIDVHPELGNVAEFVLPPGGLTNSVTVYDASRPGLPDISTAYALQARDLGLPHTLDVASPLAATFLGPEWYAPEGNHRWMPKRASLRIAGPEAAGQKLYLRAYIPPEQAKAGPLTVTLTVDGTPLAPAKISQSGNEEVAFPLPDGLVGHRSIEVVVEVSRTFRAGTDIRDLGLAFGQVEVR